MYELKIKCKVITPMFMAGADGNTPELRASEFKGMMRWWWRAIKAEDDLEKLKSEEARIFGGTGDVKEKSKVKIIIRKLNNILIGDEIRDEISNYDGLKYLYYSTFTLRSRGQPIIRKFLKPEFQFEISLVSLTEESFKKASAALWLSIYLGGFGTRARRGGGNIEVIEVLSTKGNLDIQFKCCASTRCELKKFLKENIDYIKDICKVSTGTRKYTNLKEAQVLIFEPKDSWKNALNFLGEEYKNFRISNKSKLFDTAIFGMPVMHANFSIRMVPYTENSKLSNRWSSPIILKVIKSRELYFPIVVKLSPGGISYIGKEIRTNRNWKLKDRKPVTEELLNDFISFLSPKAEVLSI